MIPRSPHTFGLAMDIEGPLPVCPECRQLSFRCDCAGDDPEPHVFLPDQPAVAIDDGEICPECGELLALCDCDDLDDDDDEDDDDDLDGDLEDDDDDVELDAVPF